MNIKISLELALDLLRLADAAGADCAKALRAVVISEQVACKNCLGRGSVHVNVAKSVMSPSCFVTETMSCPECHGAA